MKRLALVLIVLAAGPTFAEDDSHLRAAKDLLVASESAQMVDAFYSQFDSLYENMAEPLGSDEEMMHALEKVRTRTLKLVKEEMNWEKMEPQMAKLYAEFYSEEELVELTQFYLSPIGKKFVSRMPELMQASMRMSQDMVQKALPKIQALQKEFMEELTLATPEEK